MPTCSPTRRRSNSASPTAGSSSGPSSSATTTAAPRPTPDGDRDVVLEIEVDGAQQVKRLYPDAMLLFVVPPSREEQERRLRGRGDPGDKVLARLQEGRDRRADRARRSPTTSSSTTTSKRRSRRCCGSSKPHEPGDPAVGCAPYGARPRHDDQSSHRESARHGRLEVHPGHARCASGAQHQLVLQPAR